MKLKFCKTIGRFQIRSLALLFSLALAPCAVMGTDSIYINHGSISGTPPNVDAISFLNTGTWDIQTSPALYETANTLNYTNQGLMIGSPGWEFDLGPASTGPRTNLSANFFNDSLGTIEAADGIVGFLTGVTSGGNILLVQATNIVNKGTLIADSGGMIKLVGTNVMLNRGTLDVLGITAEGSANNNVNGNFSPDMAIYDEDWGQDDFKDMDSAVIWNGLIASSPAPSINVSDPCGDTEGLPSISFNPSLADSINFIVGVTNITVTNIDGSTDIVTVPTNIIRQAVFVAVSDPNISVDDGFVGSTIRTNHFKTITVQLTSALGDALYLVDTLASETNRGTLLNNGGLVPGSNPITTCDGATFRPANYTLEREDFNSIGVHGVGPPTNNFFFDSTTFSNAFIDTTTAAAYGAYIDDLVSDPFGAAVTNLPGKVVIVADNLDLTKTIINNLGPEVTIQANNLISTTDAVVQCRNLSYNLGSTVGHLNVTNLVSQTPLPTTMRGSINAWSALWGNSEVIVVPNYAESNSVTTITSGTNTITTTNIYYIYSPITNNIPIGFHVLLVDARGLVTHVPVTVQDLALHSTNMLVSDSMTVMRSFLFDGQSLTLQGSLNLSGTIQDWTYANAPKLRYFTNDGTLFIPNSANFGNDGPTNYAAFVNNGTIISSSETINSTYYQNGGNASASGGFFLITDSGKVENGSINSGQDVDVNAGVLKLNNAVIVAGGTLNLNVANSLFDAGGASGNQITCENGFNLLTKPPAGDLLGTAITSVALNGAEVDTVWAGEDRGATLAGFSNNVAVGKLTLSPQGTREPLFYFSGTGSSNALYVDELDLSQFSTNYADMLQMNPNLVIYYAAAKLGFTPPVDPNNIQPEPEEFLNGQFNNHLRWVSSFAGPNSSVDVLINGQTVSVNRALRYSKIIDSNGDGIPNFYDSNPFDSSSFAVSGSLAQTNQPPVKGFAISWTASPNTVYQVQFTTNGLLHWQPMLSYTNSTTTNQAVTVWDTNLLSGQRFYRVGQFP